RELGVTVVIEPGRSIVGNAGVLLTRVLYRKTTEAKRFVVVDAAMNDLIRPSFYDAYHEIRPVDEARATAVVETADVVGPICESGDFLAKDRALPTVAEGDLLALMSAGAYGFAMASNYNARPRAAEVLGTGRATRLCAAGRRTKTWWRGRRWYEPGHAGFDRRAGHPVPKWQGRRAKAARAGRVPRQERHRRDPGVRQHSRGSWAVARRAQARP